MSVRLKTLSHGDIESGFWGPNTGYTMFGDHVFTTRNFCGMLRYLAENTDSRYIDIRAYDAEKIEDAMNNFSRAILSSVQNGCSVDEHLLIRQGNASAEDELDLNRNSIKVPVSLSPRERVVHIGDYRISRGHFLYIAHRIVRGGLFGWNCGAPEFARQTSDAIKASERPFYKNYPRE